MERYRIMIVDDEQEVRQAIIRKMDWEKLGFQVVLEAENGQDALEKAESVPLDVVLTDIKMPFMDGFTMGRHLTKTHPGVKLIIFSGFDEFQYAQEAIKLNVVEYVLKPVNAEELAGILIRVKASLDEEIRRRTNIEELSAAYERSLPLLREQYFSGLLNGTLSPAEIRTGAERYEPAFLGDPYLTVAICHLEPRMGEGQGVSEELLPISLKKLAQERLGRLCRMEVMLSPPNVVLLTGWDHSPQEDLLRVGEELCADCLRTLDATIAVGIGRPCRELSGLSLARRDAMAAVEYRAVVGTGQAVYYGDLKGSEWEPFDWDRRREEHFLYTVKFGTRQEIESALDAMLDRLGEKTPGTWPYGACLAGIAGFIFRTAQRYGSDAFQQGGDWIRVLSKDCPPEEARQILLDLCLGLSGSLKQRRTSSTRSIAEEAERYIQENFQNPDLTVDSVCSHLHISQSYFSTIFKQETGQSYIQYLTGVRMNRAVELLRGTDDKTYLVAQQVGYDDPNYFSYVFKKRFGKSPTQFRK